LKEKRLKEWARRLLIIFNLFIVMLPPELLNTVHCMDCLEFMKTLPDKCVDLVLTDPPYWIGIDWQKKSIANNPKHNRKEHEFMWRDSFIPTEEYFTEMFRVSKNQIIRWGNYFVCYFTEWHKWWVVRDKWQHWLTMSDCEFAYSSFDCPTRVFIQNRVEILQNWAEHPTQKPLSLFRRILENYSEQWMTVLDCFAWSWTTWVACKELWRNYILVEKEPKYVDIIHKRLQNTTVSLFHS